MADHSKSPSKKSDISNSSDAGVLDLYRLILHGKDSDSVSLRSGEVTDSEVKAASDKREQNARNRKLEAEADRLAGENDIRKTVATWSLRFVGAQIFVCDALIGAYIVVSLLRGQAVPSEVIFGILATSLIEIIGILWVITRSLFPFRDSFRDRSKENGKPSYRR